MNIMLTVVIPIFAIILCGYMARKSSLIKASGSSTLNTYVYYFALPSVLFISLATAPVNQITNISFILANLIIILSGFILGILVFKLFFKKRFSDAILYGMASSYGNTGFLGIPLLMAAFGHEAAVPAAIATFMYDLIIVTLVIISFELSKLHNNNISTMSKAILKAVFVNPINISLLFGLLFAFIHIPVSESLKTFFETLGAAAGPTALFALGLGLITDKNFIKSDGFKISEFSTILGLKLIFQPLLAILLIHFLFPLDGLLAVSLVILSALPTGAVANVFAERYNTLTKEMPIWIVLCTVVSILTLSIFLMITVNLYNG